MPFPLSQRTIDAILQAAREAGACIMHHYERDYEVLKKNDASPVTIADIEANDIITNALKTLAPDIPIIAEEHAASHETDIRAERHFFLVDPLDGTKSFIKRTGEFTVNIGLIENKAAGGIPIFGVVYLPVSDHLYYTDSDGKAWLICGLSPKKQIHVRRASEEGLVVVASKSHLGSETEKFIATLKVKEFVAANSSLKFCLVAEGKADIYPRFGPTMEWDTAAGHAVLNSAGGRVENPDGTPFIYGKLDFRNGNFVAFGA